MPRIGLLAAAIIGIGCRAHPENCQLECKGTNSPCSDGLICSAEGYCVQEDWSGTCTSRNGGSAGKVGGISAASHAGSTSVAAGGSSASVWTTGMGAVGPSSAGGSAVSGGQSGGTAATGGSSGTPALSGGMGSMGGVGSAGAIAGATSASSGVCSSGQPSIVEKALAPACLGEIYNVQLTAESASSNLDWTAFVPDDWGLSLSGSGLLNGVLKRTGVLRLEVAATDRTTQCTTSVKVELQVDGETNTACPTIRIVNPSGTTAPTLTSPPPACRGWSYSASFAATGGLGTYAWQIIDPPAGFDFNPQTQILSSTSDSLPSAPVKVTLQLTDSGSVPGSGRRVQRTFAIPIRDKCWLGYLSNNAEMGVNSLQLVDPLLGTRLRRPMADSPDASILDFKFSPNGKFVAYRVRKVDSSVSLWLWQAPKWDRELELALEGSVTHYEWSSDSTVLAAVMTAATTTGTSTWLGGVKVDSVPDSSPAGSIQGVSVPLQPVAARFDEHSQLLWYGDASNKYVAFDVRDNPDPEYLERRLNDAALGPTGFGPVGGTRTPYALPVLYPSSEGYFIAERKYTGYVDYRGNGANGALYHGNAAVAPSGKYVAVTTGPTLQLRQPHSVDVVTQTDQCIALLAWAKTQERLACIGSDGSAVFSHTFDAPSGTFGTPVRIENSGDYAQSAWTGHSRLMSPSGDWLVLVTGARLFMASMRSPVPSVLWSDALAEPSAQTSLSFAPNEELLALQRGNSLLLYNVSTLGTGALRAATLATRPETCQEELRPAPTWCGSSRGQPLSKWSPDSQLLAYVSEGGELTVQDLRLWSVDHSTTPAIQVATNCLESCATGIQFQP